MNCHKVPTRYIFPNVRLFKTSIKIVYNIHISCMVSRFGNSVVAAVIIRARGHTIVSGRFLADTRERPPCGQHSAHALFHANNL